VPEDHLGGGGPFRAGIDPTGPTPSAREFEEGRFAEP
jgi:hypothetical protein